MNEFLLSKSGEVLLKATHKYISKKKGKDGKWIYDYGQTGKGKSKRSKEQVSNAQAKDIIAFKEKGLSIEEISDLTGVSTIMVRDTLRVGKGILETKREKNKLTVNSLEDIVEKITAGAKQYLPAENIDHFEDFISTFKEKELRSLFKKKEEGVKAAVKEYNEFMAEVAEDSKNYE